MPIHTVFVANRAEIARRVFRTARRLGMGTVAVASEADRSLPHAREADRTVLLDGPSDASSTYLDGARMIEAAKRAGADAIHPGYGFLAENAAFAEAVAAAGLTWIGPPPSAIRAMGDKAAARRVAAEHGVDVVPGFDGSQDEGELLAAAERVGFPVLLKATAGGGGRGMRRVDTAAELPEALRSAKREALAAFGSDDVILERYVTGPRHLEVQVIADAHGAVLALGERECSIQRRHQKVIEEAPSPMVDAAMRERLQEAAVRVARAVGYVGAGTVEFVADASGAFWFLEMNTRLQVEHPVTELVTGLDLVELQLRVADGEPLPLRQEDVVLRGWAIEARLVAEDPMRDWLPATGAAHRVHVPVEEGIRVDGGFEDGDVVSPYYDAMLAKIIASGPDRATATRRLRRAVEGAWVPGLVTNLPLLRQILADERWSAADLDTAFLARAGLPRPPPVDLRVGVLAAVALGSWERRGGPGPAGFRTFGRARQHDRFRYGAEEVDAWWTPTHGGGLSVEALGETSAVTVLGREGDALELVVDGVRQRWRVLRVAAVAGRASLDDGDLVYVHTGRLESVVELAPRFPAVGAGDDEPGACTAPTPGKVVAVAVTPGDAVTRGQRLVTLEAMKMEHAVLAPHDGVVADVRAEVGQQVAEGELLVRLEAAE
ncbi:MAG: ATP-grasp domain-containing protein [Alphaproteobacteria bacterium]|nr:ATP-grasp domain-containing protein [Alphaproteobacteria bacterium]